MLYQFYTDLFIFLPELFLLLCVLLLLLWALVWTSKSPTYKNEVGCSLVYLLLETKVLTLFLLSNNLNKTSVLFYENIVNTTLIVALKMVVLLCTILYLLLTFNCIAEQVLQEFEFSILIGFITFSLLLLLSANDLITFYLSIEMQSLCLYVLAASKKASYFSSEAGLKYFILGALSSSLLLFGMSLIYGSTGSINFVEIAKTISTIGNVITNTPYILILGVILLLCSFLFKLTAVPFHMWSPDVYEGAPFIVMVFFATIPKLVVFCAFTKILYSVFFDLYFIWQPILINVSLLTIVFSSFATLYQKKVKRFLAYSSINHVGYMLMGVSTGTLLGLHAFFLYLFVYILTSFSLFGILLSIKKSTGKNMTYLTELLYLRKVHPLFKVLIVLLFFSMAGIPPLIGFFAKFYIFLAVSEVQYYLLVTVGILCSSISAFYYIRIIKILNFENSLKRTRLRLKTTLITYNYIIMSSFLTIFFITVPKYWLLKSYYLALLV